MVNRNTLEIFDNFEIDKNLPKYTKGKQVGLINSLPVASGSNAWVVVQGTASTTTGINLNSWGSIAIPSNDGWVGTSIEAEEKPSFWSRFRYKNKKVIEDRQKTMTILNFFSSLAQSLNDLKTLQDIGIHYETAISNATKAGQTALVDKLKLRLESAKSEIQLVVMGLNKFLTEEQIVDFYNQTKKDKNLKLSWIKHFVKPIPSIALEAKTKLDEQFVFDNYVILHYDPNNDATDLTKEEKVERIKREKDPILFGVIKDSRRLYYIADWQDEYCNLTLDIVIETLQEKVGEINNESVKTYLDLGVRKDVRVKIEKPLPEVDLEMVTVQPQTKTLIEKAKETFTKTVEEFMPKKKKIKDGKFNMVDLIHLYDVIHTLRVSTLPLNEHTDLLSTEDCWNEVHDLLDKLGTTYREQLYDKESLEKILGKRIHKYEKTYDKKGVFTGFKVEPVTVAQYIECKMTILPSDLSEPDNNLS